jgi:hypothetical protein
MKLIGTGLFPFEELEMNELKVKLLDVVRGELKSDSEHLLTRQTGQQLRELIEKRLEAMERPGVLRLDFAGVGVIDFSCADEVFAKIASRLAANEYGDDVFAVLMNLNENQRENINVALERKDLAMLAVDSDGKWELLGQLDKALRETLELVMKKGKVTARDVSKKFGLAMNAVGMRFLGLHKRHLIFRAEVSLGERGREFAYVAVVAV